MQRRVLRYSSNLQLRFLAHCSVQAMSSFSRFQNAINSGTRWRAGGFLSQPDRADLRFERASSLPLTSRTPKIPL